MRLVCHQRALFLLRFREAAAIVLHPRTAYYIPQNPRTDHPKIPCTTTRAREANPHPHPHSQKYQNFECTACHVTCTHKTYMLLTTPTCTHKMPHVLTKVYIYSQNLHVLTKPTCTHKSVHLLTKCHMYSQNLHVTHKMPHVLTKCHMYSQHPHVLTTPTKTLPCLTTFHHVTYGLRGYHLQGL